MPRRYTLLVVLTVSGLLMSFAQGEAQVPHTVIGQVFNSDASVPSAAQLSFQAHLVDVSSGNNLSETRTQGDPGNAYGNGIMGSGWFEVECGNFTAFEWANGDSLIVQFSNSANDEAGRLAIALSSIQEPQISPDLSLQESQPAWTFYLKDNPDPVGAGTELVYTFNYHNTGAGAATNVTILDTIPVNMDYHSCTGGGAHHGREVTWFLGTIPPGERDSVSLTVTVESPLGNGTVITNTAHISCGQGVEAHVSQATIVLSVPAWSFILNDSPDPVEAGGNLTYTILYENTGTDQAHGVTVVDTIPAHASYASNTGGGSYDGQRVIWSLGSVPAGGSGSVTLTVNVDWPLLNGIEIENTAYITCSQAAQASDVQTTQVSPDLNPPMAVTDLMGSMQSGEVLLTWSPILMDIHSEPEAIGSYILYRNEVPYFTPSSSDSLGMVTDTFYVDTGSRAGDPGANSFYLLRGIDHVGNISENSNRVGEIDYRLPYGASGYTMISNCLDDGATSLATELGANVPNCTAVKIWDAAERGYVSRAFKVEDTWYGTANLTSGYPYYLFVSGATESVWTLAGQVPDDPVFTLQAPTGNDYNTITLPLSSDISFARDLGASIPYCTAVKKWDEQTQGYVSVAFKVGEIWFGNSMVQRGHPYYVNVTAGSTWPTGKKSPIGPVAQRRSRS